MMLFSPGRRTEVQVPEWFAEAYWGLGDRIRDARESEQITGAELCKAVGLTRSQLSRYENGHVVPSVLVLSAIAFATNQTLDWLITGRECP